MLQVEDLAPREPHREELLVVDPPIRGEREPAVSLESQEAEVELHRLEQVGLSYVVDAMDDIERAQLFEADLLSKVLEPAYVKRAEPHRCSSTGLPDPTCSVRRNPTAGATVAPTALAHAGRPASLVLPEGPPERRVFPFRPQPSLHAQAHEPLQHRRPRARVQRRAERRGARIQAPGGAPAERAAGAALRGVQGGRLYFLCYKKSSQLAGYANASQWFDD
ncbi:uncharacterized protein SOCEGT47_011840 [Sorangium cellulosum]|uniref:Uncharacterized protein n=1 Tax=Sorangium cellulosum TaxID=56 RepID=A0A4P2PVW8_SORCE|nr:uncharacterized protein SOCEGT47_011840 [Sorangium cellulosum]